MYNPSDDSERQPAPYRPPSAGAATSSGGPVVNAQQAHALRQALRTSEGSESAQRFTRDAELAETDGPTNVYYLAQYIYQLSVTAVSMSEHELGLLLPRSGRLWFNAKLFSDVPRGRELAQRDAWWRVIDSSPAVRFLLGWCISIYHTAQFHQMQRADLPGWSRVLYFSPTLPECSRVRVQFWSDVVQDATALFAPAPRIWRQMQAFRQMQPGERRWQALLAMADIRVQDVLNFLGDRNNCPVVLVQRALDGNPPINSYAEYLRFTEAVLEDLPRLRMQRLLAMEAANASKTQREPPPLNAAPSRLPALLRGRWAPQNDDPRQQLSFWQLHL